MATSVEVKQGPVTAIFKQYTNCNYTKAYKENFDQLVNWSYMVSYLFELCVSLPIRLLYSL